MIVRTKLPASLTSHFLGVLFLVACTGSSNSAPPPASPPADSSDDDIEVVREALEFIAPCSASTCGEIPPSSRSTKPACSGATGACGWKDPSPDDSVSFRECEDDECGAKPDATVCPPGTTYKGSTCGSENEAACVWRSACVPPPSTTPCPSTDGCGPMPEIGVVCKDGSNGELVCMKQGARCGWERSCE